MVPFQSVDTTHLLMSGMRLAQENHRIIANNIANADTPGFNPVKLDFEATLSSVVRSRGRISLRKTRSQHLDTQRFMPEVGRVVMFSKNDYNKVDIEEEISNLSKNTGRYNTYASIVAKKFQVAKSMLSNAR